MINLKDLTNVFVEGSPQFSHYEVRVRLEALPLGTLAVLNPLGYITGKLYSFLLQEGDLKVECFCDLNTSLYVICNTIGNKIEFQLTSGDLDKMKSLFNKDGFIEYTHPV